MNNKSASTLTAVIILLIVIIGGYWIYHENHKVKLYAPSTSSTTTSTSPNTHTDTTSSGSSISGTSSASRGNSNSPNAAAVNNDVVTTKSDSKVGTYLSDPSGTTLYFYQKDATNTSNCTGGCLTAWPAYIDKGSTSNLPKDITTFKRTDNGEVQYAYKGQPLYFYVGDKSAGQVTGNGLPDWVVARP